MRGRMLDVYESSRQNRNCARAERKLPYSTFESGEVHIDRECARVEQNPASLLDIRSSESSFDIASMHG